MISIYVTVLGTKTNLISERTESFIVLGRLSKSEVYRFLNVFFFVAGEMLFCVYITLPKRTQKYIHVSTLNSLLTGCNPNIDILMIVDASESIVAGDPYGQPLYNWNRVCAHTHTHIHTHNRRRRNSLIEC